MMDHGHLTMRQKLLKAIYPIFTTYKKLFNRKTKVLFNERDTHPGQSFYELSVQLNNGRRLPFWELRGKKVLLVNTASDCGFTAQYEELQKLYEQEKENLVVIGFPANDFRQQEKGSDQEIAEFCRVNFGVSFPLAVKASVVRGDKQQSVFRWLTEKQKNGWNSKQPSWNFSKYIVDERGVLMYYFDAAISPIGEEVQKALGR